METGHQSESEATPDGLMPGLQRYPQRDNLIASNGWPQDVLDDGLVVGRDNGLQFLGTLSNLDSEPQTHELGTNMTNVSGPSLFERSSDPCNSQETYQIGIYQLPNLCTWGTSDNSAIGMDQLPMTGDDETTYYTAQTHLCTYGSTTSDFRPKTAENPTAYQKLLQSKGLWPIDRTVEQDWSGQGQHVEFQDHERELVQKYLQVLGPLGSGPSAVVQRVQCRRILLARKTIRCNRRMKRETALNEVAHLNRLKHAHIVRVIGTYILGQDLSILLYPVADYDLDMLLHDIMQTYDAYLLHFDRLASISRILICLSNALSYLHSNLLKHMDIKPTNILVRRQTKPHHLYKVYITDFGISRSYTTVEAVETEGPTMFTRKYAAPEVADYDKRGFPADIFSLGCVFIEILAASAGAAWPSNITYYIPEHWDYVARLEEILDTNESGVTSYYTHIEAVRTYVDLLSLSPAVRHMIRAMYDTAGVVKAMIDPDPTERPSASELVEIRGSNSCCTSGPDELEASNI